MRRGDGRGVRAQRSRAGWVQAVVWTQRQLVTLAAVVGLLALLMLLVGLVLDVRPAVVVSGSMEPEISVGALVVTRGTSADSVRVGDVVMVARPHGHGLVTHRVVSASPSDDHPETTTLELKGDANVYPDPIPFVGTEVSRVVLALPGVGTGVLLLQEKLAAVVVVLVCGTVFTMVPVGDRRPPWSARRAVVRPWGRDPASAPAVVACRPSTVGRRHGRLGWLRHASRRHRWSNR